MKKQRTKPDVFSRVVGYMRPVSSWNEGKEAEFQERVVFQVGGSGSN